jgi:hypothetical protein
MLLKDRNNGAYYNRDEKEFHSFRMPCIAFRFRRHILPAFSP